jgi:hypothetical protein
LNFRRYGAVLLILLAACQQQPLSMQERGPTRSVVVGSQRTLYTFNDPGPWDLFDLPDNQAHFSIHDGKLEAYVAADRGYIMTRNHTVHSDVIINATVRQSEGRIGNGFGVVCRADAQGNGYYFLLSSSGEFTISVGTPVRDDLFQLIPWQYHSIIKKGFFPNEIRAVCAQDYLAMFINNVFVAETTDDEFTEGELGLTIGAVSEPAAVEFDDVLIRDAVVRGPR